MDFNLSGEQDILKKAVKEFAEAEIAPHAAQWDEAGHFPLEMFRKLGELGLTGIIVPEAYGGSGLGYTELAIALEEIGRHSAGVSVSLLPHYLVISAILNFGNDEQKRRWLPRLAAGEITACLSVTEPTGGSDLSNIGTAAELAGNDWYINGRKVFITNAHLAGIDLVIARTGVDEKGRHLLSAFVVEEHTQGRIPGRKENKFGLRSSDMGEIIYKDARAPQENMLGGPGDGRKVALASIGETGRGGMAAVSLGIIRACLEDSVKFSRERVLYGRALSGLQAIQFMISENRMDYETSRLLTYRAFALKDSGRDCAAEFAMAKLYATEAAVRAARRTMDLMGGYGIINEYPANRYLRDALSGIPADGTSQVMQLIIAADTLKR